MKTFYEVDIFLTIESPDSYDDILSGPFDGGLCPTYKILDKLANELDGGWANWEPYRCTYSFPNKEKSDEFCKRIVEEGHWEARKINFKRKEWAEKNSVE